MPTGLQCYDASGKLIVDLTDNQLVLFKRATFNELFGGSIPYGYFNSGVGYPIYLAGINPSDTVAFVESEMIGSAHDTVHMNECQIFITAPNYFAPAIHEMEPAGTDYVTFYKFR